MPERQRVEVSRTPRAWLARARWSVSSPPLREDDGVSGAVSHGGKILRCSPNPYVAGKRAPSPGDPQSKVFSTATPAARSRVLPPSSSSDAALICSQAALCSSVDALTLHCRRGVSLRRPRDAREPFRSHRAPRARSSRRSAPRFSAAPRVVFGGGENLRERFVDVVATRARFHQHRDPAFHGRRR